MVCACLQHLRKCAKPGFLYVLAVGCERSGLLIPTSEFGMALSTLCCYSVADYGIKMSVPPYVCGAIVLYLFALSSDHHKERGYHIMGGIGIALAGVFINSLCSSVKARYVGLCILMAGSYVHGPLTTAWLSGNTPGKRLRERKAALLNVARNRKTLPRPRRQWVWQSRWGYWWPALQARTCP